MITTIRQTLRRRRALKDIEASLLNNSPQMLNRVVNTNDEIIDLVLQAAKATLLMSEKDRRKPQLHLAYCMHPLIMHRAGNALSLDFIASIIWQCYGARTRIVLHMRAVLTKC